MSAEVIEGDCLEVLRGMGDASVDAVVTDPPYGLSFMGKRWDYDVPSVEVWAECLRVLKPGGHLLAFAGTRTQHRMAVRIEDAGFEIRDLIAWVYGSGFPKSLDVARATGDEQWDGWGTALKPALEPITVARKPLCGTVAANVLEHGTGGLNVGACRVGFASELDEEETKTKNRHGQFESGPMENAVFGKFSRDRADYDAPGRWPANLIHDGSEEVVGLFPESIARDGSDKGRKRQVNAYGGGWRNEPGESAGRSDSGSAARFFYCAKASRADREDGCEGSMQRVKQLKYNGGEGFAGRTLVAGEWVNTDKGNRQNPRNHHPTVKPTALMRYLCRLVTPPGGLVLDPFAGSGSTGRGAVLEGFRFVGIERESDYVEIARARIAAAAADAGASTELRIENCELRKSEGQGIGRRGRNGTDGGQCDLFELLEVAR